MPEGAGARLRGSEGSSLRSQGAAGRTFADDVGIVTLFVPGTKMMGFQQIPVSDWNGRPLGDVVPVGCIINEQVGKRGRPDAVGEGGGVGSFWVIEKRMS